MTFLHSVPSKPCPQGDHLAFVAFVDLLERLNMYGVASQYCMMTAVTEAIRSRLATCTDNECTHLQYAVPVSDDDRSDTYHCDSGIFQNNFVLSMNLGEIDLKPVRNVTTGAEFRKSSICSVNAFTRIDLSLAGMTSHPFLTYRYNLKIMIQDRILHVLLWTETSVILTARSLHDCKTPQSAARCDVRCHVPGDLLGTHMRRR